MAAGLEDGVHGARPLNGVLQETIVDAVELAHLACGRRTARVGVTRGTPFGVGGRGWSQRDALALDGGLKGR